MTTKVVEYLKGELKTCNNPSLLDTVVLEFFLEMSSGWRP